MPVCFCIFSNSFTFLYFSDEALYHTQKAIKERTFHLRVMSCFTFYIFKASFQSCTWWNNVTETKAAFVSSFINQVLAKCDRSTILNSFVNIIRSSMKSRRAADSVSVSTESTVVCFFKLKTSSTQCDIQNLNI